MTDNCPQHATIKLSVVWHNDLGKRSISPHSHMAAPTSLHVESCPL